MKARDISLAAVLIGCALALASCGTARAPAPGASSESTKSAAAQAPAIAASDVVWEERFGYIPPDEDTMYILLGSGYFRAPTSNIGGLLKKWLAAHPRAKVVPVATHGPVFTDEPDSTFTWVWLVDGEANLNLDLVRQGACPAGTMVSPDGVEVLVSPTEYQQFQSRLPELERLARRDKLGIWAPGSDL